MSSAVSDRYALTFDAAAGIATETTTLGMHSESGWQAVTSAGCVINQPFDESFLATPPVRSAGCDAKPLVGFDADHGQRWWVVLEQDAELALLAR